MANAVRPIAVSIIYASILQASCILCGNIQPVYSRSAYCIFYNGWSVYCAPGSGIFMYSMMFFPALTHWTRMSCFTN